MLNILAYICSALNKLFYFTTLIGMLYFLSIPSFAGETYNFVLKWGGNGSGDGTFDTPLNIAIDSNGNVYVTDPENSLIQKFTRDGEFITQWNYQNFRPWGIAIDSYDNVYVTDNDNVKKFTSNGQFIKQWGTLGFEYGQFKLVNGIAVDAKGDIYTLELWNHRVQKFTNNGEFLLSWGTQGGGNGQFQMPRSITVDINGYVYISDTENNRIQKFTSTGQFVTKWGEEGIGNGQFHQPWGISTDSSNNVYVVDKYNSRIQKFTTYGQHIATWGNEGHNDGQFAAPLGITVHDNNYIYVTNGNNGIVQKFIVSNINCLNPSTYDPVNSSVVIQKIDVPTLSPLDGKPTGVIAVFEAKLQQMQGVSDFKLVPDSLKYISSSNAFDPNNARFEWNEGMFNAAGKLQMCVGVPSVVVVNGMKFPTSTKNYSVVMKTLAVDSGVFHIDTITPVN